MRLLSLQINCSCTCRTCVEDRAGVVPVQTPVLHRLTRLSASHLSRLEQLPGKSERAERSSVAANGLTYHVKGHAAPDTRARDELLRWQYWRQWLVCMSGESPQGGCWAQLQRLHSVQCPVCALQAAILSGEGCG